MVINVSSAPFQPPEWRNVRSRAEHVINPQLHFLSFSLSFHFLQATEAAVCRASTAAAAAAASARR